MALKKIMGQNFRSFVGGSAVPEATNCSVTISGNMSDASTKDTEDAFQQESMDSKQWQLQVDSLEATVANMRALITRFLSDTPTTVGFDETEGTQNRTAAQAAFARSGQAILNDLSIQSNNRSNIQITCQYQGTGALA